MQCFFNKFFLLEIFLMRFLKIFSSTKILTHFFDCKKIFFEI